MPYGRTPTPGAISGLEQAALDLKAPIASPSLTGTITLGTGDVQYLYGSGPYAAQVGAVKHGTAAAPVTTPNPTFKVSRIENLTRAQIEAAVSVSADGVDVCSALAGINSGTAATEVQPVGVFGASKTASTAVGATNDACGVYGTGRVLTNGTGTGIGAFLLGRRDSNTGRANAVEMHCYNGGSAAAYSSTGFTSAQGLWMNAGGAAESAAGIILANAFGRQFEVGLAFNAQVTSGLTGPTRVNDIRSDSTSTTSVLINGTHATAAIAVAANAGKVGIGLTSPTSLLHVDGGDAEVSGSTKGVVLTSANATRWRITVDDTGHLVTTSL